jgi:thiol-disulfide isomerase/thioredoxin
MKINLFLLVLIIIFSSSCKKHSENKPEKNIAEQTGNSANFSGNSSIVSDVKIIPGNIPIFYWYNEKGQKICINDFKGKNIVINFWATWCSPCRNEIPTLLNIYNKHKNKGLIMLGISLDQDMTIAELSSFVGENEINYQIILDNGMLENAFGGIPAIPTTLIINKQFKISDKYVGEISEEILEQMIAKVSD